MTLANISTVEVGMQQAARHFDDTVTEFTGSLRAVNTQMAMLQASWTGRASKGFNQAMDNWEASFLGVINELVHMLAVMGATTQGYIAAEDEAANTAQSFAQALPGI
ncbi:hypothetical protein Val02_72180 [Virgisporangium aliadipatigenens]|uniref:ESAT-6-like protein n=1 Tax=Virgisporangium aliadipatigenens TaxID=741659 RepID=A0A8J3YTS3_9ACTN|nr:WXG100 family type VII secretion target [Virgisporangium aliadipatigenens]GIJ50332.1 hypothetical protein Val02_72180 [Virgisporangium aliadipatigenens]